MAEINEAVLQSYYPQSQGQSTAGQTIPSALAVAISLLKLTGIAEAKGHSKQLFPKQQTLSITECHTHTQSISITFQRILKTYTYILKLHT